MTDFSRLDSALHESTPESIAAALRYLRKADAVMAALAPMFAAQQPAAAVPDGYALVPVEPTRGMIEAGIMFGNSPNKAAIIWQNMLAAANKENSNG